VAEMQRPVSVGQGRGDAVFFSFIHAVLTINDEL
jgi:hypothetical protein